jgi:hypothetical protein
VTGIAAGQVTVQATYGAMTGGSLISVSVYSPRPTLTVSGASVLYIGKPAQLTATLVFSDGRQADVTSKAIWRSTADTVATVTSGGVATGLVAGWVRLYAVYSDAIYENVMGETGLSVVPAGTGPCNFDGPTGPQGYTWLAQSGQLLVPTSGPCDWTAAVDADWLTLTGPVLPTGVIGGSGPGAISYNTSQFEYSAGPARVANITVRGAEPGSGRTVPVVQWPNCSGGPGTDVRLSFGPDGGKSDRQEILVGPPWVCPWRVISDADWITISGVEPGLHTGDRDLYIIVSPNPSSSPRTATVYAPYHNYVVTQAGR